MAKIQNIGVGKYIRSPRGGRTSGGVRISTALRIEANDGNSFRCHPIKAIRGTSVEIDGSNFVQIPIDTEVEEITVV